MAKLEYDPFFDRVINDLKLEVKLATEKCLKEFKEFYKIPESIRSLDEYMDHLKNKEEERKKKNLGYFFANKKKEPCPACNDEGSLPLIGYFCILCGR